MKLSSSFEKSVPVYFDKMHPVYSFSLVNDMTLSIIFKDDKNLYCSQYFFIGAEKTDVQLSTINNTAYYVRPRILIRDGKTQNRHMISPNSKLTKEISKILAVFLPAYIKLTNNNFTSQ